MEVWFDMFDHVDLAVSTRIGWTCGCFEDLAMTVGKVSAGTPLPRMDQLFRLRDEHAVPK